MKLRICHPLWVHIPAVALLVWFVVELVVALPFDKWVPVQTTPTGEITRWGSATEAILGYAGLLLLCLGFIALGVFIDEQWVRSETVKRFNWMTGFDEITLGLIAGTAIPVLSPTHGLSAFPWISAVALMIFGGAVAYILEYLRPCRPCRENIVSEDVYALQAEISERQRSGEKWVYWESQNPPYVALLTTVLIVLMIIAAVSVAGEASWLTPIFAIIALLSVLLYGGLRVRVTPERVRVLLGFVGLRLIEVDAKQITEADIHQFNPLADFGGWGIRYGKGMKAYYFRGDVGVRLKTTQGKQYLIGSDHPDRLTVAVRAAAGLRD